MLHGNDNPDEGETESIDHLDEVIRPLCDFEILPWVGPNCSIKGNYIERYDCYVPGLGYEWNEDPKQTMTTVQNRGKVGANDQGRLGSGPFGNSDPMGVDMLVSEGQTAYRRDTGQIHHLTEHQHPTAVAPADNKTAGAAMRSADQKRAHDTSQEPMKTQQMQCLHLKHEAEVIASWTPVDSRWTDRPDGYNPHAVRERVGSPLGESWAVTDQVRAISTNEVESYGTVGGSARCITVQNLMKEIKVSWAAEVGSDSSAGIHLESQWWEVQEAGQA